MNASQVLSKYHGDQSYPIDLERIANLNGINLKYVELPNDVCGEIIVNATQAPLILINALHPTTHQRFTLAHELGHFFLEHGSRHRKDTNQSFNLSGNPIEVQANYFAASLLMPTEFINFAINEVKIYSISKLAQEFRVSVSAMTYRLKGLGIIQ